MSLFKRKQTSAELRKEAIFESNPFPWVKPNEWQKCTILRIGDESVRIDARVKTDPMIVRYDRRFTSAGPKRMIELPGKPDRVPEPNLFDVWYSLCGVVHFARVYLANDGVTLIEL